MLRRFPRQSPSDGGGEVPFGNIGSARRPLLGRPDHRQDAGSDGFRQLGPGFNHNRQIGGQIGFWGVECAAFCAALVRNPRFPRVFAGCSVPVLSALIPWACGSTCPVGSVQLPRSPGWRAPPPSPSSAACLASERGSCRAAEGSSLGGGSSRAETRRKSRVSDSNSLFPMRLSQFGVHALSGSQPEEARRCGTGSVFYAENANGVHGGSVPLAPCSRAPVVEALHDA